MPVPHLLRVSEVTCTYLTGLNKLSFNLCHLYTDTSGQNSCH